MPVVAVVMIALLPPQNMAQADGPVTIGGAFTLTTVDGATVTDQTYRGRWLLVYFGYTSCPDSCPTTLVTMSKALGALGRDADKVRPLFITIDPARDTPHVLRDYLLSFDPRIIGLMGSSAQIDTALQAYGAYALRRSTEEPKTYSFDHSVYLYLMGSDGTFIRGFDTDWTSERIASAIRDNIARATSKEGGKHTADIGR